MRTPKRKPLLPKKQTPEPQPVEGPVETRLNKYLSNSGVASRRKCDELIKSGKVEVNGQVILEMGYKVKPGDRVTFEGKKVKPEKNVYILLNKPKDHITTTHDEHGRRTVLDLIKDATHLRVYPVGRLDRDTTGLLLFTNDGELAKKLMHPSSKVRKVYWTLLDKPFTEADMEKISSQPLMLEDGKVHLDGIEYSNPEDKREVGIEIHEGRNRLVRRIFEHFGYRVEKLDRVYYAGLTKKNLPRGKWRFLTDEEVRSLKYFGKGKK